MSDEIITPGEAEQIIIAQGYGADFDQACNGTQGEREALAYMYLSGLAAHSRMMSAQIKVWESKIRNRPSALAGLFAQEE